MKQLIVCIISVFNACFVYAQPSCQSVYNAVKANIVRNCYVDSAVGIKHFEYIFAPDSALLKVMLIKGTRILNPWDADGIYMKNRYGYDSKIKERLKYSSSFLYRKDTVKCKCSISPGSRLEVLPYSGEALSFLASVFAEIRTDREQKTANSDMKSNDIGYFFDKNIFNTVVEEDSCKVLEIEYDGYPCYKMISEKVSRQKLDLKKFESSLKNGDYSRYKVAFGLEEKTRQDCLEDEKLRSLTVKYADSKIYSKTELIVNKKDYAILKYSSKSTVVLTDSTFYVREQEESFRKAGKKYKQEYMFLYGDCFETGSFYDTSGNKSLLLVLPANEINKTQKSLFPRYTYEDISEIKTVPDKDMLEGFNLFNRIKSNE